MGNFDPDQPAVNPFWFSECFLMPMPLGKKAINLRELLEILRESNESVLDYHLLQSRLAVTQPFVEYPNEFALWAATALQDPKLAETVHLEAERLHRRVYLMAESDLNDVRLIKPRELGGFNLDVHWNDDFHHALHTLLTGEHTGYYLDFGRLEQLAKSWREEFISTGEYTPYRQRRHGASSRDIAPHRFVVFAQNHDQVGNRLGGDRLSSIASFEALNFSFPWPEGNWYKRLDSTEERWEGPGSQFPKDLQGGQ